MNPQRSSRIIRNFTFLTTGRVLGDVFTFLLFVMLSRTFGDEGIGKYSIALAITGVVGMCADFGMYSLSIKAISRISGPLHTWVGRFLTSRIVITAAFFLMLFAVLPVIPFPRETKLILATLGAYQITKVLGDGILAVFIAREQTHVVALLEILLKAGAALGGGAVIFGGGGLLAAIGALPAAGIVYLVCAYVLLVRKFGVPSLSLDRSWLTTMLAEAVPHALSLVIFQIYSTTAVILLGLLASEASAGIYNVAFRVLFLILMVPYFAALSLLPVASRLYASSLEGFRSLYNQSLRFAVLLGAPAAAGLWLVAGPLIQVIFGDGFDESEAVLRILSPMILFAFVNRMVGAFLTAADRQAERTRVEFIASGLNVVLCLMLIPLLGVIGAALALVISEGFIVALYVVRLKTIAGWPNFQRRLLISGLGVASFGIPFGLIYSFSLALVVPGSVLLYALVLFAFSETRNNELRALISFFHPNHGPSQAEK